MVDVSALTCLLLSPLLWGIFWSAINHGSNPFHGRGQQVIECTIYMHSDCVKKISIFLPCVRDQKLFDMLLLLLFKPRNPKLLRNGLFKAFLLTITFQTAWHFASASRLKFSHDDFQTDSDWTFKINEICMSNRKPTNTLTNRIQSAFGVYFFKIFTKHVDS